MSFQLLDDLGVSANASFIDVGAGEYKLGDELLTRDVTVVTVLEVSSAARDAARQRVGTESRLAWCVDDALAWTSDCRYGVWLDHAVFHFKVGEGIVVWRSTVERTLTLHRVVLLVLHLTRTRHII
ncbi:MAG TPA: hypothetical protein VGZ68_03970 [Acidimicrobiales bacterium]|jgi:hypothetical protein|nr:hypothetical protein [Acidimicrobiales bacterium]